MSQLSKLTPIRKPLISNGASKSLALTFGTLAMVVLIAFVASAWTEPTANPPTPNVSTPLNIGSTGQSKAGGLILNTGGAPNGLIVQNGNVGIGTGTTSPGQKLTVAGIIESTSGGIKFPDGSVQDKAATGGALPADTFVLTGTTTPPAGYLYTDSWLVADSPKWHTDISLPTARGNFAIAVVNNKIYAIGGHDGSNYLNRVDMYDPATGVWTPKANMPTARNLLAVGVVNNKIYAIGGRDSDVSGELSTNEEYDPITNTWTAKAPMPTSRNNFPIGVVNNKIYAIGGSKPSLGFAGYLIVNEEYDPATDAWATKASALQNRWGAGIGVVNNKIYVFGGGGHSPLTQYNQNEEYNPTTDSWSWKASMPTPRNVFAAGVVNNKIYAIGGGGYGVSCRNINEVYDPQTNTWANAPSMPAYRCGHAIGVIDNRIYVIGGETSGESPTDKNDYFNTIYADTLYIYKKM